MRFAIKMIIIMMAHSFYIRPVINSCVIITQFKSFYNVKHVLR